MPLAPPPDNTKTLFALAIGVGLALILFVATRSTLPHVGDNIHHLPHGGRYRDGTKSIDYCSPGNKSPSSSFRGEWYALIVVFGISFYLFLDYNSKICVRCGTSHRCSHTS
ncbi:triple gene block protein 2 [Butterbur mosaic virus]|uniref:Movement protein TGB2 n=1 Tax=Butterbur mosaic virus TaxID=666859 RepID=D2Z044_9VIRU|nr:triple gene block protein 2 [Butterbur mosaic virus]BAI49694.1 triple gene block protein 2 [Butterbur mosaic virus]